MKPRQTYYGVIPIKKSDKYEIVITDPNIYNLIIVLNTESGDAELKVSKELTKGTVLNLFSLHDDYIPDVIRISPKRLNSDNIIGKYQVKVFSKTFSTYLLYYYTTFKKEKSTNNKKGSKVFFEFITRRVRSVKKEKRGRKEKQNKTKQKKRMT